MSDVEPKPKSNPLDKYKVTHHSESKGDDGHTHHEFDVYHNSGFGGGNNTHGEHAGRIYMSHPHGKHEETKVTDSELHMHSYHSKPGILEHITSEAKKVLVDRADTKVVAKSNGQWTLEKNWKKTDIKAVSNWGNTGDRKHLAKLPAATGELRNKMLSALHQDSKSRFNKKTKEKEYKVYRAADIDDQSHGHQLTSWTPNLKTAHIYTDTLNNNLKLRKVLHAWVPEKHVHSYLPPVQKEHKMTHSENEDDISREQELLVHPHDVQIDKTVLGPELEQANKKYLPPKPLYEKLRANPDLSRKYHGKAYPGATGQVWHHVEGDPDAGGTIPEREFNQLYKK